MAGKGEEVRAQRDQRPTTRLAPAPARTGLGKTDHYRQRTRAAGDQPAQNEHGKYSTPKKSPAGAGRFVLRNAYLLVLPLSFFSSALAFALPFVDLALALPFFAVLVPALLSAFVCACADGVAGFAASDFGAWA